MPFLAHIRIGTLLVLLLMTSELHWTAVEASYDSTLSLVENSTSIPLVGETRDESTRTRTEAKSFRAETKRNSIYDHNPLSKLAYTFKGEFYGMCFLLSCSSELYRYI